jgi:hypothetical protein
MYMLMNKEKDRVLLEEGKYLENYTVNEGTSTI